MLTLQYIRHSEIENLESEDRIEKLLDIVRKDNIILLEGRLTKTEEASLIQRTMESINSSFKGIEIASIDSNLENNSFRAMMMNLLAGNRAGVTVIGPANVVKEIKKQPDKIQLLMQDTKRKTATTRKRAAKSTKKKGKK